MADISLHFRTQGPLAGTFTTLAEIFATWLRRARERRELATLDSATIRDLGLSPNTIHFEANKPFWRE